jgi:hypothetical protein
MTLMQINHFTMLGRCVHGLWALLVICSIVVCAWFVRPFATPVDLTQTRYFDRFGEREPSAYADFRWSFPQSNVLFPQRWVDFATFPTRATGQIVTIHLNDMRQPQALQIADVVFQSDALPRVYHVLTAHSAVVPLQSSQVYVSPEQRQLGVQVFAATRQSTRLAGADVVVIWLQVLLVLAAIVGGTWALQRIVATAVPAWLSLVHVAVWVGWWLASPAGSGEFIMAWGFVAATLGWLRRAVTPWRWSWPAYITLLALFMLVRVGASWWQAALPSDISLVDYNINFQLPVIWEPYWSWCVWLLVMVAFGWLAGRDFVVDWWVVLWSVAGVLVSLRSNGYWPVHTWMYVISLDYLGTWQGVWEFLRTSRVAIPPLLLVIEFAIHNQTLPEIIYVWLFPRAVLIVAMLIAVFRGITDPRERMVRGGMLVLWMYAFTAVKTLDNYFIYDVLFGALLLFAVHLAYRQDIVWWQWAVVGGLLVLMDSMRPFGMVVLLVVAPWLLWRSWQVHRWAGVLICAMPLLISVAWHSHHIVNLGQANWSNHTGFNLCNAWECPRPADMQPEAPPVADGLWPNINTEVHQQNSQRLLQSGLAYQLAHPGQSLIRAGELLLNVFVVPYEPGQPALIGNGWLIDIYRAMMLALMLLNVALLVAVVRTVVVTLRRRTSFSAGALVGHVVILLLVLVVPNLTEYGENYRFVAGSAMWLAALPPWAEYRAFVAPWLPIRSS